MSTPFTFQSAVGSLLLSVSDAWPTQGLILAAPPASSAGSTPPTNQLWTVVRDPLGSGHHLIMSQQGSNQCLGVGINVPLNANVTDDATDPGVVLTLQPTEPVNNHYQLWSFLPVTGSTGDAVFIQNPQTGYVLQLQVPSEETCLVVVDPRRITNDSYQLWSAIDEEGDPVDLPRATMAQLGAPLDGNSNYVFLPASQKTPLVGVTVTMEVIEDIVVPGFTLQINCNTPYLGPDGYDTQDYDRDAQWMQFGLYMQNSQLTLFNQAWHRRGGVGASELESMTETSPLLLNLSDNTIPAGTRIVMNLCTDQNDFLIGIAGVALDASGLPLGSPVYWPILGQPSWHSDVDGGVIHQKAMAPIGAFQVTFSALPSSPPVEFTSGMGTVTVTASPDISAQGYAPNPHGIATGETSNMPYDLVPANPAHSIAQPFGFAAPFVVPHTKFGGDGGFGTVIIEEPGGRIEVLFGDAPGPATVFNDNPDSPGDTQRGRTAG